MKNAFITTLFTRLLSPGQDEALSKRRSLELVSLQESLTGVTDRLKGLHASTEQGFLTMGARLQDIYSRSRDMSDLASEVLQSMTGEEVTSSIEGLAAILQELKGHLEVSEAGFDKIARGLNRYLATLDEIETFFDKFRTLVLNLDMLGFFTQVENAHVTNADNGFLALTTDVKSLSKRIFEKSAQIRKKSQELKSLIHHALHEFMKFKESHKSHAMSMLKQTVANQEVLASRYQAATGAIGSLSRSSRDIMGSIGDIVSSLQFHDITSQQIAHVGEVIAMLQQSLSSPAIPAGEKPGLIPEVCSLQAAQVRNTRQEAFTAVDTVMKRMSAIRDRVREMLEETRKVSWTSDADSLSFMEEIDAGIHTVIEGLDANISEQTGLANTMSSVSSMVSEMSVFVEEIENLGLNLQLIALNARIKAAHIGSEGAALDTISGSIYELSKNSREDTNMLSHVLSGVVDIARDFDLSIESMHSGQEQVVETLVTNLKGLLTALHAMNDSVFISMIRMNSLGEELTEDIGRTVSEIRVHEEIQESLGSVVEGLETVQARSKELVPPSGSTHSPSFMKELERYYTMESEHRIHAEHAGSGSVTPPPAAAAAASEYGDNVELF